MEGRQGYSKGINQDLSSSKRDPNSYYYAKNFRIVTDEGLSTGSLENELGHVISFKLPDIEEQELENGDTIPEQTNLRIIGTATMVDTIIIFSTSTISATPDGYGQIWKLKYDEYTGTVENLSGDLLTVADHLVYNNKVDFSTEYRIKAVCRYENLKTQRVYWTDNYNPVRAINLADPDIANFAVDNLDLRASINQIQGTITGISNDGNLRTQCKVQFGYRLTSSSGTETLYSPVTCLVNLIQDNFQDSNLQNIDGDGSSSIKNKSVSYNLIGLDTDYDIIEHIVVVYDPLDTYTVYKFDEDSVPLNGNLEVICSDLDNATIIDGIEFNMLSSGFSVAKDLEVKGNRLIAANLRNTNFDLTSLFDARTYRFDSSRESRIYDSEGNLELLIDGGIQNYPNTTTELEFDAINKYNDESDPSWSTNQYKYQVDGTTLGGNGPNISYTFTTLRMNANELLSHPTVNSPHVTTTPFTSVDPNYTHNVLEADGNTKEVYLNQQHPNFASQWASSEYVGYTRGEIYRFGIVFYDKKGSTSFVNWIGDIRFPDVADGFPLLDDQGSYTALYSLGINFTVDVTAIADQISGYSIVRLERSTKNSTKLGSGLLMVMDRAIDNLPHTLLHRWEFSGESEGLSDTNPYQLSSEIELFGSNESSNLHLNDMPGHPYHTVAFPSALRVCYLLSPMGQLYNTAFKNGDYIDVRGYYSSTCALYGGSNGLYGSTVDDDSDYMFYYKMKDFEGFYGDPERFQVGASRSMSTADFIANTSPLLASYTGGNNVLNTSYARVSGVNASQKYHPLGMGSPKLLLLLSETPTIPNNTGDPSVNMQYPYIYYTGGDAISFDALGVSTTEPWFKEVMYSRYLTNQYGGNNYESRSLNQYISTGHYQYTADLPAANLLTFEVFGGDTYVTYYDDETIQYYLTDEVDPNNIYKSPDNNNVSVATVFPVEVPKNTYMRVGNHWAANRDGSNPGEYESNRYDYPEIFSQENNAVEKFYAKDFVLDLTEEYPHRMWASEVKIDGEFIDSWRIFKIANIRDVDGIYGPINALKTFKDNLLYYQDRAFGIASLDERSVVTDESGQQLVLGTGGVFPDYNYISTNTGTVHQFSVTDSDRAVYHYDARLRKIFRYSGAIDGLSDVLGLSSFLDTNINGAITNSDRTTSELLLGNIGVHSVLDLRYNRVLFTFLNNLQTSVLNEDQDYELSSGTYFNIQNVTYLANEDLEGETGIGFETILEFIEENPEAVTVVENGFTISYNEMFNCFESFYDYKPNQYLQYGRRLLSVNPFSTDEMYVHNIGEYCTYYDQDPSTSVIHTILAADGLVPKIWNNISYNSELYDSNDQDIYDETFNRFRMFSNYQDTDTITLTNNSNIKRRMRTWNYTVPRDNTGTLARIRNPWVSMVLEYDNNQDKRLILHDITYSFTPSKY